MTAFGICSSTHAIFRASFRAGITKLTAGGGNATSGGDNDSVMFRLLLPLDTVEAEVLKPSWEPLVISAIDMSITASYQRVENFVALEHSSRTLSLGVCACNGSGDRPGHRSSAPAVRLGSRQIAVAVSGVCRDGSAPTIQTGGVSAIL